MTHPPSAARTTALCQVSPQSLRTPGGQVFFDALAAGMLVTIMLDTWRITFGGIVDNEKSRAGLTWGA